MKYIMSGIISLFLMFTPVDASISPAIKQAAINEPQYRVLGEENYSLKNRYGNTFVNDVFADNILLTLAYMNGTVKEGTTVPWEKVRAPFEYHLVLQPGQVFAFHDKLLPEYQDKSVITTNSKFNSSQGFRTDGWLVGDGVCHLASFINVVAKEANLDVKTLVRHDFAKIEDVAREDGVSIKYDPNSMASSTRQNLYITNNREKPVTFVFRHENNALEIEVKEVLS